MLTRRAFLATTGLAALEAAAAAQDQPLPIIDTHQHLWDRRRFRLEWIPPGSVLDRNYGPDDYRRAIEGLNVVKSIYMEVDVHPSQQADEVAFASDLCRSGATTTVAAIVSARPAAADFAQVARSLARNPSIRGIRQVLHAADTPPGFCLQPAFIRGIRLLGELGLSFDLTMRSAELADGAKLAAECPETTFILDHCGNPDLRAKDLSSWRRDIDLLARRENVACKVSGIVASTRGAPWTPEDLAPVVNHVLDAFGPRRVVFGGDWPVCLLGATLRQWVEALRQIVRPRPIDDQRALFHDNAARIYRLEP